MGGEFAVSTAEQRRQIQALRTLGACLAALAAANPLHFAGTQNHTFSMPSKGGPTLDLPGIQLPCTYSIAAARSLIPTQSALVWAMQLHTLHSAPVSMHMRTVHWKLSTCCHVPGLSIRLYHPESAPVDTASFLDTGGDYNLRTRCIEARSWHLRLLSQPCSMHGTVTAQACLACMQHGSAASCDAVQAENPLEDNARKRCLQSYVADDGCLHIVADRHSIQAAVASLDLSRARLLTRLNLFWLQRVRCCAPCMPAA